MNSLTNICTTGITVYTKISWGGSHNKASPVAKGPGNHKMHGTNNRNDGLLIRRSQMPECISHGERLEDRGFRVQSLNR